MYIEKIDYSICTVNGFNAAFPYISIQTYFAPENCFYESGGREYFSDAVKYIGVDTVPILDLPDAHIFDYYNILLSDFGLYI